MSAQGNPTVDAPTEGFTQLTELMRYTLDDGSQHIIALIEGTADPLSRREDISNASRSRIALATKYGAICSMVLFLLGHDPEAPLTSVEVCTISTGEHIPEWKTVPNRTGENRVKKHSERVDRTESVREPTMPHSDRSDDSRRRGGLGSRQHRSRQHRHGPYDRDYERTRPRQLDASEQGGSRNATEAMEADTSCGGDDDDEAARA
ncbi:uncharacterized protein MKK02DRAFT_30622 [Dioszegia hungarica]|uniref:Uncharacterized protein n=1 Tax=Dioszegia hungarica TaxID=4972 RepID=A0AA38H2U5_9TREE|nr:uncharacterized protein MKK02DRAFT_30622 [Dioszegia hungarica]KAI9632900.1 hypothetical protein MKK02DRAFT_30622 [Dioszegia hungarica]